MNSFSFPLYFNSPGPIVPKKSNDNKIEKIENKKIIKVKMCITDAKENEENEEESE